MDYKNYLRLFFLIACPLILLNVVSVMTFIYNPKMFYNRPWEYFHDITYKFSQYNSVWDEFETSDLTRDNYFYYQDPHKTYVSVDKDGFRSNKFNSKNYKVLITGDSTIFGSGLSDNETLPWKISEAIDTPVFNGGRTSLWNILKRKELLNVEIIVDCVTERDVKNGVFMSLAESRYQSIKQISKIETASALLSEVSPQRYLLTSIIMRVILRISNDIILLLTSSKQEYLFHSHHSTQLDLDSSVAAIIKRKEIVEASGLSYVFIAVPAKQSVYDDNVDPFTKNYINTLTDELVKNNVKTINILKVFRENSTKKLFHNFDSHWNSNGTKIASSVISEYLISEYKSIARRVSER